MGRYPSGCCLMVLYFYSSVHWLGLWHPGVYFPFLCFPGSGLTLRNAGGDIHWESTADFNCVLDEARVSSAGVLNGENGTSGFRVRESVSKEMSRGWGGEIGMGQKSTCSKGERNNRDPEE